MEKKFYPNLLVIFVTSQLPLESFLTFAKGSLTEPCNYRPISLLHLISKVIEKVTHGQTSTFLNSKKFYRLTNLVFEEKPFYGFLLCYLSDKILKGFNKGMMTVMTLTDLQNVFDTIDHDLLLEKLYVIGFSKHTVNWFKSYLSNRFFLVNLGNNFSQLGSVSYALP